MLVVRVSALTDRVCADDGCSERRETCTRP